MKKNLSLLMLALSAASLHATVLLQDSKNYPYTNGPIAGQGKWYVYDSQTPAYDTFVTNNVIYLTTTGKDTIATPTNGFYTATNGTIVWASFNLTVNEVPNFSEYNGSYFCQFISTNSNTCCNLFISTNGVVVPGAYRLSIANFSVSFSNLQPPVTFPEDLATNVTYTIVIAYDSAVGSTTEGANLMIDPSSADYGSLIGGGPEDDGFVYGTDTAVNSARANVEISAIDFSPYINAGISNLIIATAFSDVYTNAEPPVFGVQPSSGTNYSGNSVTLYSVAAGSDLSYQWHSTTSGVLTDDGVNIIGSKSNILTLNNLSATAGYYVVATDATNRTATSDTAVESVNTTPTAVFFAPNVLATNLTNNLFVPTTFADFASGTGPISYQWYFKSTNAGAAFVPLPGQTSPSITLSLADYTYIGQYYVVASNPINGGSTVNGPTNTLVEVAPVAATLEQLHTYLANSVNQIAANPGGTVYINTNNVTVSGYVSSYRGYGSSYTTFYMQDANGYGLEVFLGGFGNTNAPPIGTYVTASGPLEVYHSGLELAPASPSAIVASAAPAITLSPFLGNPYYNDFASNPIGSNALHFDGSLVTFTNVYLYGNSTGGPFGSGPGGGANSGVGGVFTSNSYTILYATVGAPYSATNTNTMEVFQPTYDYRNGSTPVAFNPFDNQPIPTNVAQLTGIFEPYGGSPSYVEVIPMRYQDYLTTSPAPFNLSIGLTNKAVTVNWPPVAGATYSMHSASSVNGPWTNEAFGLGYYPTNGAFGEGINFGASAKFFRVTSP